MFPYNAWSVRLAISPATVSTECAGGGKFSKLVADHVLGHVALDEGPAIVNHEGVTHKIRSHRASSSPCLDRVMPFRRVLLLYLLEQLRVDVGALLDTSTHFF